MEPVTLTAAAIATLAFTKSIETVTEERLGKEHPNTITVRENLERCRAQGGEGQRMGEWFF